MKHLLLICSLLLAAGAGACSPASGDPVPPAETPAVPESPEAPETPETPEENDPVMNPKITLTIGGTPFAATLENNAAAAAFCKLLPLTITMEELNGNEKYHYLETSLPTDASVAGTIRTGDLKLYGSSCVVLFYETFPSGYSYTPLGRLNDPAGLAEAVGRGSVTVTFSADENK